MPFPAGGVAVHDDTQHSGSAKRNAANGLAGLDASSLITKSQLAQFSAFADVTASRAFGTVYQNTSGNMMLIFLEVLTNTNGGNFLSDASNPPTTARAIYHTSLNASLLAIIVQPSHYYKAETPASGSITKWMEYS